MPTQDETCGPAALVWKAYRRSSGIEIGPLKKLGDFDLTSDIVRKTMAQRYGKNPPLTMDVISPADMFASPLLETVAEYQPKLGI